MALEHSTAGFAKTLCSAVFITGLDPADAAANVGFFTGPPEARRLVTDPTGASPVLKREVVDEVLARLGRGKGIRALARSYGVETKTIRAAFNVAVLPGRIGVQRLDPRLARPLEVMDLRIATARSPGSSRPPC